MSRELYTRKVKQPGFNYFPRRLQTSTYIAAMDSTTIDGTHDNELEGSDTFMLGNANIDSARLAGSNVPASLNNGKGGNAPIESNVSILNAVNLGFSKNTSIQAAHPSRGGKTAGQSSRGGHSGYNNKSRGASPSSGSDF